REGIGAEAFAPGDPIGRVLQQAEETVEDRIASGEVFLFRDPERESGEQALSRGGAGSVLHPVWLSVTQRYRGNAQPAPFDPGQVGPLTPTGELAEDGEQLGWLVIFPKKPTAG